MRIAVDIMGGDNAPHEIVQGAVEAAQEYPQMEIILVGKQEVLAGLGELPANISTCPSVTVMGMDESLDALRKKRDSSIWIATKLVKDGEADAVVSAGSTGAQMGCAFLQLGRIAGIERPAIVATLPTKCGGKVLLDIGANTAVTAEMLLQFAIMGNIYSQMIFHIDKPRVALLSNGTEAGKGTDVVVEAYQLLSASGLNFVGNKEARDISCGEEYDVMVCDGFTGNIVVKLTEGLGGVIFGLLKEELTKSFSRKIGAMLVKPGLGRIKDLADDTKFGGAPLVGVNGISIICHGSSKAVSIKNAIRVAGECVEKRFVETIKLALAEMSAQ